MAKSAQHTANASSIHRIIANFMRGSLQQFFHQSLLLLIATALLTGTPLAAQNGPTAANWAIPTFYSSPGTGATATATLSTVVSGLTLTNAGSGYTGSAPTVGFSCSGSCTGRGATATVTMYHGTVLTLTLTAAGSGYNAAYPPSVTFTCTNTCSGGSGATATATLTGPLVYSVAITNGGSGYAFPPTVTFSSGAAAGVATVTNGTVLAVTLTNGGNYPANSPPTVTLTSHAPAYQNNAWNTQPTAGQIGFTFTVPSTPYRSTSAVVVNPATGNLIRTLWTNRAYPTGTWGEIWDGTDDYGTPQPAGQYTVKLLTNNVTYTWDGLIGNTEGDWGGPFNWDNTGSFPRAMAFINGTACEAAGYNEGFFGVYCFPEGTPNSGIYPQTRLYESYMHAFDIATDGSLYYELFLPVNTQGPNSEILAFDTSGNLHNFPSSTSATIGNTYVSGVMQSSPIGATDTLAFQNAYISTPTSLGIINSVDLSSVITTPVTPNVNMGTTITGLAVETGSTNMVLATGHGEYMYNPWDNTADNGNGGPSFQGTLGNDTIYFWNKVTGAPLGSITTSGLNPQKMAFDTSNNLWIIGATDPTTGNFGQNNKVWEVKGIGTSGTVSVTQSQVTFTQPLASVVLPGLPANRVLSNPMSLATSPNGDVFIMDGGTNQQVIEFNSSTYVVVSTLGTVNGFSAGTKCSPTVDPTGPNNPTFDFDLGVNPILNQDGSSTRIPSIAAAHQIGVVGPWTSAISIDETGGLWIMDWPNERILHYKYQSGAWVYNSRAMMTDWAYQAVATPDVNNTSRIFGGFMGFDEYKRNYQTPLAAGDPLVLAGGNASNEAWELVRNWLPCVLAEYPDWDADQYVSGAFTLTMPGTTVIQVGGNRWTADHVVENPTSPANPTTLYEFNTADGSITQNSYVNHISPINRLAILQPGTGKWYQTVRSNVMNGNTLTGYTYTVMENAPSSYDNNGFPMYPGTGTSVGSYTANFAMGTPRNGQSVGTLWPSPNQIFPIYDTAPNTPFVANGPAFHLGGLKVNGSALQWQTMPQAALPYPDDDGSYPSQVGSGGTIATALANNTNNISSVITFYDGNWDALACQYTHFTDDGMFVGQFGYRENAAAVPPGVATYIASGYPTKETTATLAQGMCGDVGTPMYVQDTATASNGGYYAYIGDEGYHRGVQEWHITNLNSIAETVQSLNTVSPSMTTLQPISTITYGQPSTLTATVTSGGLSITPSGTVTFSVGSTTLGSSQLNGSGVATFTTTALPGGTDTVTASYAQSQNFLPSSGSASATVNPASTTLAAGGSSVAATFGTAITLTATVTAPGISYPPTGTVAFKTGSNYDTLLGSGPLNGTGFVSVNSTNAPIGADGITAFYTPSGSDFTASQSEIHITVQQSITGTVYAGTTPVNGATIQFYQVGVGSSQNYVANAIELLGFSVTTNSNGVFTVPTTGGYTCTPGTYVYATASGGNAGPGTNPNLALMASIGPCTNLSNAVTINEVTTVAAAYAFAQFGTASNFGTALTSAPGSTIGASTAGINIATSSTNVVGIANAAQIAQLLASPSGASPGSNGNGAFTSPMKVGLSTGDSTGAVAEFWQINTIANMLDACIKTTGGVYTNTSTNCGMLFANVQAASGTNPVTNAAYAPPADTIQAAVYLALTPAVAASNIANLAPLAGKFGTFTPYVSSASAIIDYTVAIQFIPVIPTTTTTLLTQPTAVAIDSNGNAWVVNQAGSGTYVTTAIELSPTGVPMQAGTTAGTSPNNYLLSTYTMGGGTTTFGGQLIYNQTAEAWQSVGYLDAALDTNNNLWLNDRRNDNEVEIVGSGAYGSGISQNGGNAGDAGGHGAIGFQLPTGSAPDLTKIDAQNDIWIYLNGLVTGGVEGTGMFSNTCGMSYTGYNTGLIGFLGESSTNVVYGGPITPNGLDGDAFAAIDPVASLDKTTAGPIEGAPFLWTSFGLYIYQNYTQAASTVPAGCYTPLQTIGNAGSNSGAVTYLPGMANTPVTGDTTYATGDQSYDVAFDNGGNLWISALKAIDSENTIKSAFIKLAPNYGSAFTSAQADANFTFNYFHNVAGITDSGTVQARFMAIDGAGDVWFTYNPRETIGEVNNLGVGLSPTGTTPGFAGSTCTNCSYAGGTAETYSRNTGGPRRPAIDLSGNVWLAQEETNSIGILMLVGAAPPTGNPISLALKNGTVGKKP
jgi:hypothetical protein